MEQRQGILVVLPLEQEHRHLVVSYRDLLLYVHILWILLESRVEALQSTLVIVAYSVLIGLHEQ